MRIPRFRDRREAGIELAQHLMHLRGERPVVLALPRGGVPVGFEIARALDAPLDLLLVRKIGAPHQPELAVGAVVDGAETDIVLNEDIVRTLGVSDDYIRRETARELEELERRRAFYLRGRRPVEATGATAIVVDDGIATGATVRAALRGVRRRNPAKLVLAAPVAPPETVASLQPEADEIVCVATPDPFMAVGAFYRDFPQLSDEEVIALMEDAAHSDRA